MKLVWCLNNNWRKGQTNSGHLGDWLVRKRFFICMQSIELKKEFMLKFKMNSRTCFIFMIAFTFYEERAYIDVWKTQKTSLFWSLKCVFLNMRRSASHLQISFIDIIDSYIFYLVRGVEVVTIKHFWENIHWLLLS